MSRIWIVLALGSAVFAGVTSILAKIGIKNTDSDLATAIRTIVVAIFAWGIALAVDGFQALYEISARSYLFLGLSGLATGISWICYFDALKHAEASKVAPIDKSSTIISILLAAIIFGNGIGETTAVGIVGIAMGTILMLGVPRKAMQVDMTKEGKAKREQIAMLGYSMEKIDGQSQEVKVILGKDLSGISKYRWLVMAILSAVFAALTPILAKIGIEDVPSQLGTAIRTVVVLVMAWGIVLGRRNAISFHVGKKNLLFIVLSGIATGASWLCYYAALKKGEASTVIAIDKLSIVITVLFAWIVLKEKPTMSSVIGLVLITLGAIAIAVPSFLS